MLTYSATRGVSQSDQGGQRVGPRTQQVSSADSSSSTASTCAAPIRQQAMDRMPGPQPKSPDDNGVKAQYPCIRSGSSSSASDTH